MLKNYKRIFPEILGYNYLSNSSDITEILLDKYVGRNELADAFEDLSRVRITDKPDVLFLFKISFVLRFILNLY